MKHNQKQKSECGNSAHPEKEDHQTTEDHQEPQRKTKCSGITKFRSYQANQKAESERQFDHYIDNLAWEAAPRSNHDQTNLSFLRGANLGVDAEQALEAVVSKITEARGRLVHRDVHRQLQRAYDYVRQERIDCAVSKSPKVEFNPELISKAANRVNIPNISERIAEISPIPPCGLSSAQALKHIYKPGEKVRLFTGTFEQGSVFDVSTGSDDDIPSDKGEGVYMLLNTIDGEDHPNPREGGKISGRSLESLTSFGRILLESDSVPIDDWLKLMVQLPLRIISITESGGKSAHVQVGIESENKDEFDMIREEFLQTFVPFGADRAAMSAVRLTRLPGAMRNGKLQKLLYLNPRPSLSPIIELINS